MTRVSLPIKSIDGSQVSFPQQSGGHWLLGQVIIIYLLNPWIDWQIMIASYLWAALCANKAQQIKDYR